ncbi:putative 37S ribosomal protein S26A [Yarrowia sp. C11]|nr:putative 37S ribosomal protein S26A [Yarrowia sp. E02]KAG5372647.1 putative 37S ribosomal protein S26A [Yarrowia sp. C11]
MFRNVISRAKVTQIGSIRSIHTPAKLARESKYAQNGLEGLYSKNGFNTAWTDYQRFLVSKLTDLTVDTPLQSRSPFDILRFTAADRDQAATYNFASQAFNNHFFFEALAEKPVAQTTAPTDYLRSRLEEKFESMERARENFLATADEMTGNGWVFLYEGGDKNMYISAHHNAGSPFSFQRFQHQEFNFPASEEVKRDQQNIEAAVRKDLKESVLPLLAVNVWQQAYVDDYGVNGKYNYLENYWECINWDVVNSRLFVGAQ